MDVKQILSFIKIEHTLFSLPFILIGYFIALEQFNISPGIDLLWILLAAVGARGLAMALNRIIDRDIDAANPRTEGRLLASGEMSLQTAWTLSAAFLAMLLIGAGLLNPVALMMAWLPVLVFVVYPYTKRYTWLCHLWLGLCLGLAPAGAWVAIAADVHSWAAITGMFEYGTDFLWAPTILPISLGVALWIAAFDINYARMDVESDRESGIHSFPSKFGENATTRTTIQLTLVWFACFAISDPMDGIWFLASAGMMAALNIWVVLKKEKIKDFQTVLFRVSMLTGWILLLALIIGFMSEPNAGFMLD
ncbi:MAG: 4-hydroxybenzoate octaprenyltransferase [Euryarchaeota archaeon]|nr:4-hydroxybenzoate octaprenyltransferase [Euryarchaeota archaeon]MBT5594950.1 4-hydroxybenzoate octaprenyltransferase [Euryarchaeota archaeon]MBT5843945.1 4-hydroxybenzoate octaprenyltransferase [Euryarchaeota archaeon]MBT6845075.1 4-hydroxybenzoate octaprenyltransferase [Euryarchaeota archaeon]MBT7063563.1 4-hydroxybenzoate octaprenyltransferase [Euryarchaeota archaeon]